MKSANFKELYRLYPNFRRIFVKNPDRTSKNFNLLIDPLEINSNAPPGGKLVNYLPVAKIIEKLRQPIAWLNY